MKIDSLKLKAALAEDIGKGDITSNLLVPAKAKGRAVIIAKEPGVFAGSEVARAFLRIAGPKVKIRFHIRDGQSFTAKKVLLEFRGSIRSILKAERTLLNLLQHLCGIATITRAFAERVKKSKAKGTGLRRHLVPVRILDTRKTTPLWRDLEKAAVKAGGGHNHRMGLYDAVFVKENHRKYGNLRKLLDFRGQAQKKKTYLSPKAGFEIEVRNVREMMEALMLQPKVILFDNFTPADLKKAVRIARRCNPKIILEASGGVTLQNVVSFAKTGVDQISIGSLTHSVKAIDLSLLVL